MKKNLIKHFIIGSLLSTAVNFCFADTGRYIYNFTGDDWTAHGENGSISFYSHFGNPACYDSSWSCLVPHGPDGPNNVLGMRYNDDGGFITLTRDRDGASISFHIYCDNHTYKCRPRVDEDPNNFFLHEVDLNSDGDITIFPHKD